MHSLCYFIFDEERYLKEFLNKYKEFKIYDRDTKEPKDGVSTLKEAKSVNESGKVYPLQIVRALNQDDG